MSATTKTKEPIVTFSPAATMIEGDRSLKWVASVITNHDGNPVDVTTFGVLHNTRDEATRAAARYLARAVEKAAAPHQPTPSHPLITTHRDGRYEVRVSDEVVFIIHPPRGGASWLLIGQDSRFSSVSGGYFESPFAAMEHALHGFTFPEG